jgi:hypothetical protein
MQTNIITYLCFLVLCGLVVLDMWFCSSVVLQIVCILLVVFVVSLVAYIAFKHHKGTYTTKEQQSNYQSVISHNVELTNELNTIKQKAKQTAVGGVELQTLVLTNRRLTAQITNLKTHLQTVSEQLQTAKNSKQTAVVPITPNEQKQTASNNKKAKTA